VKFCLSQADVAQTHYHGDTKTQSFSFAFLCFFHGSVIQKVINMLLTNTFFAQFAVKEPLPERLAPHPPHSPDADVG
jgi:hypothetical protein